MVEQVCCRTGFVVCLQSDLCEPLGRLPTKERRNHYPAHSDSASHTATVSVTQRHCRRRASHTAKHCSSSTQLQCQPQSTTAPLLHLAPSVLLQPVYLGPPCSYGIVLPLYDTAKNACSKSASQTTRIFTAAMEVSRACSL